MAIPRAQFDIRARDRSKGAFSSVRNSIRRVTGVATRLAGALGLVAGPAAFGLMIRQSLKVNDALAKTSDKLGITTEALAGLQRAAEQTGVASNTMDMAFQRMTRRLAEAAQGTGEAEAAIKELGLDAKELIELSPDQAFIRFAGAMAQVENQADRVRLGFKLFDSEGVAVINTLALGADGLRRMRREAEFLGIAMSRGDAAEIENFNDALNDIKDAARGAANTITVELARSLGDATREFAFTIPIAIQKSIANVREMQSAYFDLGATIQEVLLKRDEADKAILEFIPGGESFAQKFLGYDPDQLRQRREFLNHLKTERDFAAKQAEDALSAVGRLQQEREELLANPPRRPDAVDTPDTLDAESRVEKEIAMNERLVQLHKDYQTRITQINAEESEKRKALAEDVANKQQQLNQMAVSSALGLFQVLGQENKNFARAAIILSKGMAIAQILSVSKSAAAQSEAWAQSAAILAYQSQLIPGFPPSLAAAQAAYAATIKLGHASAAAASGTAAVAATLTGLSGIAELAQLNRSPGEGAPAGSSANPINTTQNNISRDMQRTFTRKDADIAALSPTTININIPEGADPQAFERWIENNRGTLMTTIQSEYDSRGVQGGPLR